MLIMLAESARFNHADITPKKVDLSPKHILLNIHLEISNSEHLAAIKLRENQNLKTQRSRQML